jgi:outer membrane immunogenic protein
MTIKLMKAGVAAAALVAVPFAAVAADIRPPVYKGPARSVIAFYNWTGPYIGATVGYGSGTSDWNLDAIGVAAVDTAPKGMIYGLTAGYNWHMGSLVYGLEADYNFSNVRGSVTCVVVSTCETENSWLATFRGRIGYAFDRFLPYITAGGAYGDIRATTTTLGLAVSDSESKFGYTIGAGLEYAFLSNWTVKGEYLYVDLGSFSPSFAAGLYNVNFSEHILRAGLNYRF